MLGHTLAKLAVYLNSIEKALTVGRCYYASVMSDPAAAVESGVKTAVGEHHEEKGMRCGSGGVG